jgi:PAS domain S-box-containing protein
MTTDADAFVLLDALFANAPVGLAYWDADLRYRRVNAALAEINGIAPDDHLGRTPSELLGPVGAHAEELIREVLTDGLPRVEVPFEGETPALPGEPRHWKGSFYAVTDEAGGVVGVGAVIVEVTAERLAQREQLTASALVDAVFSAAPVGIAFWDLDLRYRRVNEALAEMDAVPPTEHLGRTPEEVLGEAGRAVSAMLRRVADTGEALIDAEHERRRPDGTIQHRQKTVFPVVDDQGGLVGLAGVVRDVTEHHAAEAERTRLLREALTARAAAEAAQVRAEAAQAEAELARRNTNFLASAGERLAMVTRDYEETLQEVASVAVPVMADWCIFTLLDERGTPRTVAVAAADPEDAHLAKLVGDRYPVRSDAPTGIGDVLRTGEPQLLAELSSGLLEDVARDEEHLAMLRGMGLSSGLTVPLRVHERTIGALSLVYAHSGRRYGPDELRLAESLAARAALAVENARLYTERSHIAQTLQRSLLPPALPEVPGLELAARYRAAGQQNEVGGDFYDVFRAADGVWTVLIGDVSGKGAEAAALTSLSRHTLRAASLRTLDPIENLELLNEALWSQTDLAGRFCTVVYTQVRPAAHGADVTLATGGHLPPIIVRADGRVERVALRGGIVGGLRGPTFGSQRAWLDHGDLLLLFTDGVVELRRPGAPHVQNGDELLEAVLREHHGATAADLVAAVEERVVAVQDGEPRDDIALVAVRPRA